MRREPAALSAGERLEQDMKAERRHEKAEALAELLESPGWRQVLLPAIELRMQRIEKTLAGDDARCLEAIRVLQGEWRGLARIASTTLKDTGE